MPSLREQFFFLLCVGLLWMILLPLVFGTFFFTVFRLFDRVAKRKNCINVFELNFFSVRVQIPFFVPCHFIASSIFQPFFTQRQFTGDQTHERCRK